MTTERLFTVRATHKQDRERRFVLNNLVAETSEGAKAWARHLARDIVKRVDEYRFEVVSDQSITDQE